jgi:hypothetical protein
MIFKYICSLGPACATGGIIKMNNLKTVSYPFDWVFSSLDIVEHCLKDNFHTFLKKKYYKPIANEKDKCGHKKYGLEMFQHRNPMTKNEDYNYYIRCVERFRNLLTTHNSKLFVMVFINQNKSNIINIKQEILKFNDFFKDHTTNYKLCIIIQMVEKNKYHKFEFENVNKEVDFLYVFTKDEFKVWGKGHDRNDTDYVNKVFTDLYKFDLSCE